MVYDEIVSQLGFLNIITGYIIRFFYLISMQI